MTGADGNSYRFSVVIPTYRRREVLLASVAALASQEEAPAFEVIVVVDGSDDGSAEALRTLTLPFPLTVLEQTNQGPAAARNRGVVEARGEIVLFLDDDMEADPRLLAEHERFLGQGFDVVFGDFPIHPDSRPGFLTDAVGAWAESRTREFSKSGDSGPLHELITGQMSIARELFLSLGGFDTGFTQTLLAGNADLDFGHRLTSAGFRIGFNPDAVSRQRYVVTPNEYLSRWREIGRADVMFARKHPDSASTIFVPHRRERRSDRLLLRWLRGPLRLLVLGTAGAGWQGERTKRWFYRVRNLEYFGGIREAGGIPARRSVRVLCYHAIADLEGAPMIERYGVRPDEFRRQVALLRRYFHVVSARELVGLVQGTCGVPRRAVLLTFDDCSSDLFETALPILREHGVPAVGFAVTKRLGETNDWSTARGARELRLVDAGGLRQLVQGGVEIGSHTRTHPHLTRLSGKEAEEELTGSAEDLEALGLGRPDLFAYPYGEQDAALRRMAASAGYAAAFTVEAGQLRPGQDPYAIPRIEILRVDSGWRFLWKVVAAGRRSALRLG